MTVMIAYVLAALVILTMSAAAHYAERLVKRQAVVSSVRASHYVVPRSFVWIRRVNTALCLLGLAMSTVFGLSGLGAYLLIAGAIALHGNLLFTLYTLVTTDSAATATHRIGKAFKSPKLAEADFLVFFSGMYLSTPAHVEVWIEPIKAADLKVALVMVEAKHFRNARRMWAFPVLYAPTRKEIAAIAGHTKAKAVLYTNNGFRNNDCLEVMQHLTHVQLLHGDSDKPASYRPGSQNYDRVFVAGQMAKERYWRAGIDIPDDRFRVVGRPQVAAITPPTAREGAPVVGYMPTWEGNYQDMKFSSLAVAGKIMQTLSEALPASEVLVKPHPLSQSRASWAGQEAKLRDILGQRLSVAAKGTSPFDAYNAADVLIADISSVIIDFLYSGKPIIVILPHGFGDDDLAAFPSLEACYKVDADLSNLGEILTLATTADPMRALREDVRHKAFGDIGREPGEAFREACAELLASAPPAPTT